MSSTLFSEPVSLQAAILERPRQLAVSESIEISGPDGLRLAQVAEEVIERYAVGEQVAWGFGGNAKPEDPEAAGGDDVRQQIHGFLERGGRTPIVGDVRKRHEHLAVAASFVFEPAEITIGEF